MDTSTRQPRFLKWSLVFAIAIVANLFIGYTLSLVYKAPVYNDYCPTQQVMPDTSTQAQCVAVGGQWTPNAPVGAPNSVPAGYCDQNYTCGMKYSTAQDAYSRNVFTILISIGVLLIIAGSLVGGGSVVRTGLSFAGSLSLIVASVRYWGDAHDWLKVLILAIALAALIVLAVKKFNSHNEAVRP